MEQIIKITLAIIFGLAVVVKLSDKTKDTCEKSLDSPNSVKYVIAVLSVILLLAFFVFIYR
jgi:hypothetical protein